MVLKRLFDSKLAELYVEGILPSDIEAWKDEAGAKISCRRAVPQHRQHVALGLEGHHVAGEDRQEPHGERRRREWTPS
jgi:hypothetical protein